MGDPLVHTSQSGGLYSTSVTFFAISPLFPLKQKPPSSTGDREFEIALSSEISRRAEGMSVKIYTKVGNIRKYIHAGFRAAVPQIRSSGDNSRDKSGNTLT